MENGIKFTGLMYIQSMTTNRVRGSNRQKLKMFRELTGDDNMDNVVVLTTFWDSPGDMLQRERLEAEIQPREERQRRENDQAVMRAQHEAANRRMRELEEKLKIAEPEARTRKAESEARARKEAE
ncbi:hypothetical protein B0T24DRAFT_588658 [Lasiosphaeria ovina]|uniref:Uncharacterized protein n=1 Tax=Lasiosphaeria ovina TaxID=92902 RepID=A0AAE0NME1_9PEZI|nr:hypothetical protein B0T24DRAFT_588658 [Lasiosphaeria ovina]